MSGFVGNALPIMGVGVLSTWWGSVTAAAIFAVTIGAFIVAVIIAATRPSPRDGTPARG